MIKACDQHHIGKQSTSRTYGASDGAIRPRQHKSDYDTDEGCREQIQSGRLDFIDSHNIIVGDRLRQGHDVGQDEQKHHPIDILEIRSQP